MKPDTFETRLQTARDKASDPKGVVVVRWADLNDALSLIWSLRRTHDERTEAIAVLTTMAAGAKS